MQASSRQEAETAAAASRAALSRQRPRGLAAAVGSYGQRAAAEQPQEQSSEPHQGSHAALLDTAAVSDLLHQRLGFTTMLAPSGIASAEAGTGLWLRGSAQPGAVVSLYPGIVYKPLYYR